MILSDNETRIDRLNNMAIAKTIVAIIKDSNKSISIGVHGDWGAGKSSVLAMVEDQTTLICQDNASMYAIVRFNSWQYQGFEDAKIALMSAIVSQLEEMAELYYKEHKVEDNKEDIKEIGKRLWKNLDKLSLAKGVGKIGVSLVTGTAPLVIAESIIGVIKENVTDPDKAGTLIEKIGSLVKNPSEEPSGYKEIDEFRQNFKELFKAAHVNKLVVLIDDLDRCLPKVAIETLEAVRMFLTLENAAFIIAADDAMIRYSVKEYFPGILEQNNLSLDADLRPDYNLFADKYLEKLIQIPLHIPRIGLKEAQLYIMLLLIESKLGESDKLERIGDVVIEKLHKPWALEQLSTEEIKEALVDKYDEAIENIKIAKSIDKILSKHTNGNPRNIKRFINMLLLRNEIAQNRGFDANDLQMAVLAKMMLAEQYNSEFYKALAGELDENGHCKAFETFVEQEEQEDHLDNETTKKVVNTKLTSTIVSKMNSQNAKEVEQEVKKEMKEDNKRTIVKQETFKYFLGQRDVINWIQIPPSLVKVDLRPYFFACTEKVDFFFSNSTEQLQELVSIVRSGKLNTARKKEDILALNSTDAKKLFKIVSQDVFTQNLSDTKPPRSIEGIRLLVEYRSELQNDLVEFLLTLQPDKLGIWATGEWDSCIPKKSEAREKLKKFLNGIAENSSDPITRRAAKYV